MSAQADLEAHGYKVTEAHKTLRAGRRVHHHGEQWDKAQIEGTAVIVAVLEKNPSSWSNRWGGPDIEVVVARDDGTEGQWASYVTHVSHREQDEELLPELRQKGTK